MLSISARRCPFCLFGFLVQLGLQVQVGHDVSEVKGVMHRHKVSAGDGDKRTGFAVCSPIVRLREYDAVACCPRISPWGMHPPRAEAGSPHFLAPNVTKMRRIHIQGSFWRFAGAESLSAVWVGFIRSSVICFSVARCFPFYYKGSMEEAMSESLAEARSARRQRRLDQLEIPEDHTCLSRMKCSGKGDSERCSSQTTTGATLQRRLV